MLPYWQHKLSRRYRPKPVKGKEGLNQYFIFLNGKLLKTVWIETKEEAQAIAFKIDKNTTVG